jgi:DNA mismatch repair protein MutS2
VAITGPNTGGKTASLKTLGLAALMVKAGLGLVTKTPATIMWFDRVLVDLGDGQSLEQSLSTFSGHVRRLRNILAALTPHSLVLVDELGSGTDPSEGAALAAAILTRFAVRLSSPTYMR